MKTKSVGRRKPSSTPSTPSIAPIPHLSSTPQHNVPVYDTTDDDDEDDDQHQNQATPLPETEPLDSIDDTVCIICNEPEGSVLICSETGCPISVHVSCIGSEPKFDGSGNFYCPYCWYKRTLNNARLLREKALIAKKALSSFLEKEKTVREDDEEVEQHAEPVQDSVNRGELKGSVRNVRNRRDAEEQPAEPVQDPVNRGELKGSVSNVRRDEEEQPAEPVQEQVNRGELKGSVTNVSRDEEEQSAEPVNQEELKGSVRNVRKLRDEEEESAEPVQDPVNRKKLKGNVRNVRRDEEEQPAEPVQDPVNREELKGSVRNVRKRRDEEEQSAEPVQDPVNREELKGSVRKNEEEQHAEPVQDRMNQDELRVSDSEEGEECSDDKGKVSVTGSSVSETKDSESEAVSVKKKSHAKRNVASVRKKKSLVQEPNGGGGGGDVGDEEEVTSGRTVRLGNQNQVKKHTSLTRGKRKRLFWTAEEENALKAADETVTQEAIPKPAPLAIPVSTPPVPPIPVSTPLVHAILVSATPPVHAIPMSATPPAHEIPMSAAPPAPAKQMQPTKKAKSSMNLGLPKRRYSDRIRAATYSSQKTLTGPGSSDREPLEILEIEYEDGALTHDETIDPKLGPLAVGLPSWGRKG